MAYFLSIIFIWLLGLVVLTTITRQVLTPSATRVRVSKFFELLEAFIQNIGIDYLALYEYQEKGIRMLFQGLNLFVVLRTGGGKSLIAYACMWRALLQKKVGVYLVPHTRLMAQKAEELRKFFGNTAHIVKMSGDQRPTQKELQKNQKRLIIVATYESFRAFCFAVQNRKYFDERKCFGAVVIDEVHHIGSPERGVRLETLIYKLQQEHEPQFCMLSATFSERDANEWSERFNCELIYRDPMRKFKYREVILPAIDYEHHRYAIETDMRMSTVVEEVREFLITHLVGDPVGNPEELYFSPAKLLVFCHSRAMAEQVAERIDRNWGDEPTFWSAFIHAGLTRTQQDAIFNAFKRDDKARVLVCTPLLETGVDVKNIKAVIITAPEYYSAIQLMQACGRSREEEGEVVFIILESSRHLIDPKYELNEERTHLVKFNLETIWSNLPDVDIIRLVLELLFRHQLTAKILTDRLWRLSNHPQYHARLKKFRLRKLLATLEKGEFIRKVGGRYSLTFIGKAVVETGLGFSAAAKSLRFLQLHSYIQMDPSSDSERTLHLLSGISKLFRQLGGRPCNFLIDSEYALYLLTALSNLFGYLGGRKSVKWCPPHRPRPRRKSKRFSIRYLDFLADLVACQAVSGGENLAYRLAKRERVWAFIRQFNRKKPARNLLLREKHKLREGDERILRRTAAWLASSMLSLYRAQKLHRAAMRATKRRLTQYYQFPFIFPLRLNQRIYRRFLRVIDRYRDDDDRLSRKPKLQSHGHFLAEARFSAEIKSLLNKRGKRGATIHELRLEIRMACDIEKLITVVLYPVFTRRKRKSLVNMDNISVLYYLLNGVLEASIYRERDHKGQAHRPPYRYWLRKYRWRPRKKLYCKDCEHFRKNLLKPDNTHCKLGEECPAGWRLACEGYTRRQRTRPYFIRRFEKVQDQVQCPNCARVGTVQEPSYQKLTVCNHCAVLLRQVQQGRYQAIPNLKIRDLGPQEHHGFLSIPISRYKATIHLKQGETLRLADPLQSALFFTIEGRRGYICVLDNIFQVLIKGGRVSSEAREVLDRYNIPIEHLPLPTSLQKRRRRLLREKLLQLDSPSRLEKARDMVLGKMISNIIYTKRLGKILPPDRISPEELEDLTLKQFDQMVHVLLMTKEWREPLAAQIDADKYMNKLRSREGNAEIAAWAAIKQALPARFRFKSRQVQRTVRTALYQGPRAYDAYNCALNYIFRLLARQVKRALGSAGFHGYYPGSGIIHHRRKRATTVEHRTNQEFVFDFMDTYRAPFRYYLTLAFLERDRRITDGSNALMEWYQDYRFTDQDFWSRKDEWGNEVFFLTKEGASRVRELFKLICKQRFYYQETLLPLEKVMEWEAQGFAHFLLNQRTVGPQEGRVQQTDPHATFIALDGTVESEGVLKFYQTFKKILDYDADQAAQRRKQLPVAKLDEAEQAALCISYFLFFFLMKHRPKRAPLKNVIIVTHTDFDGFASALLLFCKYYHWNAPSKGNVRILTAVNNPYHPSRALPHVLERRVPRYLLKGAQNIVLVADFPVAEYEPLWPSLHRRYVKRLRRSKAEVRIVWFDHHQLQRALKPEAILRDHGIELHHDQTKDTYQIIWDHLQATLAADHPAHKLLTHFRVVDRGPFRTLVKAGAADTLDQWHAAFERYQAGTDTRPQHSWLNFFRDVVEKPEPPPLEPVDLVESLHGATLSETGNGKTFATLLFREPFSSHDIVKSLRKYIPSRLDFLVCYWYDHTLSLYTDRSTPIDLSPILEYHGKWAHRGAGRIYIPSRRMYRANLALKAEEQVVYIHRYRPLNEFISWVQKEVLATENPSLNYEETQIIPSVTSHDLWKEKDHDVTPIQIELARGKTLQFPRSGVNLLFGDDYTVLQFLHSIMHAYQARYSSKILYIDTAKRTLRFSYFLKRDASTSQLKRIYFTKIADLPAFTTFIKEHLYPCIKAVGAALVIITSPFALISKHWDANIGDPKVGSGSYFSGGDFALDLKTIAEKTGTCLLVTSSGAVFDWKQTHQMIPLIPEIARHIIKYKILVTQPEKVYSLEIQADQRRFESAAQSATIIPLPRKKRLTRDTLLQTLYETLLQTTESSPIALQPLEHPLGFDVEVASTTLLETEQTPISAIQLLANVPDAEGYLRAYPELDFIRYGTLAKLPHIIFALFHFKQFCPPERVRILRESVELERDIDICLWYNSTYSIYSEELDLSPLTVYEGKGSPQRLFFDPFRAFAPLFKDFFKQFMILEDL